MNGIIIRAKEGSFTGQRRKKEEISWSRPRILKIYLVKWCTVGTMIAQMPPIPRSLKSPIVLSFPKLNDIYLYPLPSYI